MTRLTLLAGLAFVVASSGLGCMTFRPVGPMKTVFPPVAEKDEASAEPVLTRAPRPVPPALLVTPGEVTEGNYRQAVEKLKQELEQDRRSLESMPKPADVSVVKGRI
jgi:hypothetical protein